MIFATYLLEVSDAIGREPRWRVGQAFFNVLYEHKPTFADKLRGGPLDPFYNDRRLAAFLVTVQLDWDSFPEKA